MEELHFSHHAIERCADMGISPGLVEEIVRNYSMSWKSRSGNNHGVTYVSHEHPYAVVLNSPDEPSRVVVTVLFWTHDEYKRDGERFVSTRKVRAKVNAKPVKPKVDYKRRKRERKKQRDA